MHGEAYSEIQRRKAILDVCHRLHVRGWLAACDGNVSVRDGSRVLITPSARHKGFLIPSDLAEVTVDNKTLSGKPSSERLMHLAIYRQCPKAVAVVHAHPPTAIAWSIAYPQLRELPSRCISEVILAVGAIPIVPYARPGTEEMGNVMADVLPHYRAMILARHGAVAWGESLEEAYMGIERIEHSAQILMHAQTMGGLTELPDDEVRYLQGLRAQMDGKIL